MRACRAGVSNAGSGAGSAGLFQAWANSALNSEQTSMRDPAGLSSFASVQRGCLTRVTHRPQLLDRGPTSTELLPPRCFSAGYLRCVSPGQGSEQDTCGQSRPKRRPPLTGEKFRQIVPAATSTTAPDTRSPEGPRRTDS